MRMVLLLLLVANIALAQGGDPKALGRASFERTVSAGVMPPDFDPAQSAGLFVGINDFTDGSIVDLRFAADDAVDTAWFFANSGLVPADRIWICLSGSPAKESSRANLKILEAAGATIKGGNYDEVYDALIDAKSAGLSKGLLVLQFSSHGTSADPDARAQSDDLFLFLANTRKFDPRNRTINLATIRRDLGVEGHASRTLILLDACREKFDAGKKAGNAASALPADIVERMRGVRGAVTIFATRDKGYSFDGGVDPLTRQPIRNGVFIHFFLTELATKRSADPATGAVRVEDLVKGINTSLTDWVKANSDASAAFETAGAEPGITYLPSGPEIMQLPLAVDLDRNRQIAQTKDEEQQRLQAARLKLATAAANDDALMALMPQVPAALANWDVERRAKLITELEAIDPPNKRTRDYFAKVAWPELIAAATPTPSSTLGDATPTPANESIYHELSMTPSATPTPADESIFHGLALNKNSPLSVTTRGINAGDRATITVNGVEFAFRWCPPGTFTMGSPEDEEGRDSDEGPQTTVTLSKGFWMGETEVTQAQWKAIMKSSDSPSSLKGDTLPVENVAWSDSDSASKLITDTGGFLSKANGAAPGARFKLPTEAQWEYACRAGTTTPFHLGSTISTDHANYNGDYAYGNGSTGANRGGTVPVGSFTPNEWGLQDMHGNVAEWCSDLYADRLPGGSVRDYTGPASGFGRVVRGGSWSFDPQGLRSAYRYGETPFASGIGFRICSMP